MINESIYLIQLSVLCVAVLGALKLGKNALIALICLLSVMANLLVLKQINFLGLTITTTDTYTVGILFAFNMLQEYFGKKVARQTLWLSLTGIGLYTLLSWLQLCYVPSIYDVAAPHYQAILGVMPRIAFASITAYFISIQLDRALYGFLQKRSGHRHLVARNYITLLFGQLIDTVLFSVLGLYGLVANLYHIVIVSYTVKVLAILVTTPFLALASKIYPQK